MRDGSATEARLLQMKRRICETKIWKNKWKSENEMKIKKLTKLIKFSEAMVSLEIFDKKVWKSCTDLIEQEIKSCLTFTRFILHILHFLKT